MTTAAAALLLMMAEMPLQDSSPADQAPPPAAGNSVAQQPATVTCSSKLGEREQCRADTSQGVVLLRSMGDAPCLLGRTWGYDQTSVWVSDGCSAEFGTGSVVQPETTKPKAPSHIPNVGFLLFDGEKGQIYFRLFSYARYLNQRNLDESYVDAFGNEKTVQRRQDIQLQKFFAPFSGWFLTPKMRYYLYVWSSNASQGDPAQVVGAGNLTWSFNRYVSVGVGITSLPTVRSTEGQFPYWLGVDNRLIADEFFRGSYTSGVWLKGEFHTKVKYMAMFANNLSTLGVSAAQLDNKDGHAVLLGAVAADDRRVRPVEHVRRLRRSPEGRDADRRALHPQPRGKAKPARNRGHREQPDPADGRERHLHAGSVRPGHHGQRSGLPDVEPRCGRQIQGAVSRGRVLLALVEQLHRRQHRAASPTSTTTAISCRRRRWSFPRSLQMYFGTSQVFGGYGDQWEVRAGENWYLMKERGIRLNAEWMYVDQSPGRIHGLSLPGRRQGQRVPHQPRAELLIRRGEHDAQTFVPFGGSFSVPSSR